MKLWTISLWIVVFSLPVSAQETSVSLTLRECIELALRNNIDISVERINPLIEEGDILAAYGDFDPRLTLALRHQNRETPLFEEEIAGNRASESRATTFSPSLLGKLPTGTEYDFSYDSTRQLTSPDFDHEHRATGAISLAQPLLRNFGFAANLATLRIAKKNRQIARYTLLTRITETVNEVHKAYYDLKFAMANLQVQEESLEIAKALLAENKKRLEVGLMSPLDVTQAESGVASQEETLIQAQQEIKTQSNRLRRLIASDVAHSRSLRPIPVDKPIMEPVEVVVDESITRALQNRPEYLQQKKQIEADRVQLSYDFNQLFPQINVEASYGQSGLGTSFESAFDSVHEDGDRFPTWLVGVVVDIPLGNAAARGRHRASRLRVQQSILELKGIEQDIIIEVDNAAAQVETNLKRIEATRAARRLAEETLNAEQKKLEAGTTTSYTVLQQQRDLTDARTKEIRAIADYNLSLAELYRVEGTLLAKYDITLKEDE